MSTAAALANKKRERDDWTKSNEELEAELLETKHKLMQAEERAKNAEERAKKAEDRAVKAEAKLGSAEESDFSDDGEDSIVNATDPWNVKFQELREYRLIHGHCNVPRKGSNPKLGSWVDYQRTRRKGNSIPPERVAKLESIGFSWGNGAPQPLSWDQGLDEIKKYQKAMGHCNIIISPTTPSPLAKWVSAQRSEYKRFKKGRDSLLTLEQIGQLKEIGFKFKIPKRS